MLQTPYYLPDWEVQELFQFEDPQPHEIWGDMDLFSDYDILAASFNDYDGLAKNDGQPEPCQWGPEVGIGFNANLIADDQEPYYAELQNYTELSEWYSALDFALTTVPNKTPLPPQLPLQQPSGYPQVHYSTGEAPAPISQEYTQALHSYTTPGFYECNGESYPPLPNRFDQVTLAPLFSQSGYNHSYHSSAVPLSPNAPTAVSTSVPPATPLAPSPAFSQCLTPASQWSNSSSSNSTDFQDLPHTLTPLSCPVSLWEDNPPYAPPTPTYEAPATSPYQNATSASLAAQSDIGPIRNSQRGRKSTSQKQNRANPLARSKRRHTYHDSSRDEDSGRTKSDVKTVFTELGNKKFFQLQGLNGGLYLHPIFECSWEGCGRIIRRDDYVSGSQGQEDFQKAFIKHLDMHVDSAQKVPKAEVQASLKAVERQKSKGSTGRAREATWKTWSWTCKWLYCSSGSVGSKSDLRRHYLTHIDAWRWYCTYCKALRARKNGCRSSHGGGKAPITTQAHTARQIDLLGGL